MCSTSSGAFEGVAAGTSHGPLTTKLSNDGAECQLSFAVTECLYLCKHVSAGAFKGRHELVLEGSSEAVL